MHGMLSAAVILVVFAMVAAVGGGSTVWLYLVSAAPSGRNRKSSENPENVTEETAETGSVAPGPAALEAPDDGAVADTRSDLPAPDLGPDDEHDEPPAAGPGDEEFSGARIYMLDSYPRSGR